MMEGIVEGDIVEVIGKVKEYDGERYINPEMVVERGPEYELLRALEIKEVRDRWQEHVETARELREDGRDDEHIVQELQGRGLDEMAAQGVLASLDMDADAFEAGEPAQRSDGASGADGDADAEDEDRRASVLAAIDALDDGDGAEYGAIQTEADIDDEEALEDVINDLLSDGTCYEPRPGRIKKL